MLLLLPSQSGCDILAAARDHAVLVFLGAHTHSLLGETLAGLHVFGEWLPSDVHLIQALAAAIIGIIMPADNMIHVRWIVASRVLAERAEGKLLNGFATSLCFGLQWQVAEAVLNMEFLVKAVSGDHVP